MRSGGIESAVPLERGTSAAPVREWSHPALEPETGWDRRPDPTRTERELIELAKSGDRAAFEALYAQNVDRVWGYLAVTLRNHHDAEELTHEVFVRMLENVGRYEWRNLPFSAWLLRIARNLAVDLIRRRRYELVPDPAAQERDGAAGPDELVAGVSLRATLDRELDRLPAAQKQAVILRFYCGFSHAETATILERSVGAVKLLQQRATTTLAGRATLRNARLEA